MDRDNVKEAVVKFKEELSLKDISGIMVGSLILVIAIQGVLIPANLLTGGITGLAILFKFLTGIDVWVWFTALNIPIFIAGYRFVSRRFVIYSLLATITQAVLLGTLKINLGVDDQFLAAIFGGALSGLGIGIIFRYRGSSGGLDIIAVIARRFWGYNIGQTFFFSNLLVLAASLVAFNLEMALFSAVAIFLSSSVVDMVEAGPRVARTVLIISDHSQDIAQAIIHTMHRGCTYLPGEGAYSGDRKKIIMVTVGKTQLPRLKEIVFKLDPQAFITINETIEAYGKGFKSSGADF